VGFLPPTTPNYIRTASPKGRTSCLLPTTPNYPALLRGAALEQLPSPDVSGLRFASQGKNVLFVTL